MARRSQWGRNLDADDLSTTACRIPSAAGNCTPQGTSVTEPTIWRDEVPETAHAHQKRTSDDDGIEEFEQVFR